MRIISAHSSIRVLLAFLCGLSVLSGCVPPSSESSSTKNSNNASDCKGDGRTGPNNGNCGHGGGNTSSWPYSFSDSVGVTPLGNLTLSGDKLFGVTSNSGNGGGCGTVFRISTEGTGMISLHIFTCGLDGAYPQGSLVASGSFLYGTTTEGGSFGKGTVFRITADGSSFTTLYNFTGVGADGGYPVGSLTLSGTTLFGLTNQYGQHNGGVIFKINVDGSGMSTLQSLTSIMGGVGGPPQPQGKLVFANGKLYGTAEGGGANGQGTAFSINDDGTGMTVLHDFAGGADGSYPYGSLLLSSNVLYGMTFRGGANDNGTLFRVNIDGTGMTILHSFVGSTDGGHPYGGLVLSGNSLYGMTNSCGTLTCPNNALLGYGTIFQIQTDGTGMTTLYKFTGGTDGANPVGDLLVSGNTFFGMTKNGGTYNRGVIFKYPF